MVIVTTKVKHTNSFCVLGLRQEAATPDVELGDGDPGTENEAHFDWP